MDTGGTIERMSKAHAARTAGDRDIDQALLLVQEGMLKMLRFQLALVRQDRRVAMEAIDGVLSLERQLEAYVQSSGSVQSRSAASQATIAGDRAALVREKFTLAAGHVRDAGNRTEAVGELGTMPHEPPGGDESPMKTDRGRAIDVDIPCAVNASLVLKLLCAVAALVVVAAISAGALLDLRQLEAWRAFELLQEGQR